MLILNLQLSLYRHYANNKYNSVRRIKVENRAIQNAYKTKTIKENLLAQLTSPVRWTESIRNMAADGMSDYIECGPGKVLTGLISKILK